MPSDKNSFKTDGYIGNAVFPTIIRGQWHEICITPATGICPWLMALWLSVGAQQVERKIRAMSRSVMSRSVIATLPKRMTTFGVICAATLAVSACQTLGGSTAQNAAPVPGDSASAQLAAVQEVFDASAEQVPTLTAVGYAVVSSQPGRSDSQKRLMAIRSARMAAMRDLAEQIHGLQVDSSTTVIDLMVQNDTFRGVVSGTIRGARTVRINPTGSDTYEIVLEIDREMVSYLIGTARGLV